MNNETQNYLEVDGLGLQASRGYVYHDVSFSANKGQVIGIFGDEGSGKTSLLLTLSGRMKPTDGKATIAGLDLRKEYRKIRDISGITIIKRVNDVPENLKVYDILAAELQLAGKKCNRARMEEYFKLWDFCDREKMAYRDLPSNDRSLFGIMLACVSEPELLMVDDIQIGLTQHRAITWVNMFKEIAAERGMTVLFGVSEYDIAKYADGIVVMSQKAEEQRCNVIADQGQEAVVPIFGSSSDAEVSFTVDDINANQEVA